MHNLRRSFDKGIDRFEKKLSFVTKAVYTYSESSTNGNRKSLLFLKKSVGFQPLTITIAF